MRLSCATERIETFRQTISDSSARIPNRNARSVGPLVVPMRNRVGHTRAILRWADFKSVQPETETGNVPETRRTRRKPLRRGVAPFASSLRSTDSQQW